MRIAVLGTGDVGKSLANAFLALGHEVKMGAREKNNPKALAWVDLQGAKRASAGTFAEAAAFGELVVLATLGVANEAAIRAADLANFDGKVVIDTTNPLDYSSGAPKLAVGHTDSGGEGVQRLLPKAHVVKAFNTVGHALFFRPAVQGGPPDMFLCGNDDGAKAKVADIVGTFGWNVVDMGGIEASRYLEPMCMTWVLHGLRTNTWSHAFKFLKP